MSKNGWYCLEFYKIYKKINDLKFIYQKIEQEQDVFFEIFIYYSSGLFVYNFEFL